MNGGIYQIVNSESGKRYVGSAERFKKRWNAHRAALRRGTHGNRHLQSSWVKHGEHTFEFEPILYCAPKDLLFFEQRAIDALKPEYNHSMVAGSNRGIKYSAESRAKISAAMMGNQRTLGQRRSTDQLAHLKGNRHSVGRVWSAEKRSQMILFMTGNSFAKGAKHTPEMRALKSEGMKVIWAKRKGRTQ